MKKLYTMMILLLAFAYAASSQVLFNEDFSSGVPPTGWSIDAHAGNWSQVSTANAGGTAPEAQLYWSPQFVGESYLISPVTNTTGYTALGFSFRHSLDHYGGAYTLGVATRSAAGAWNTVWELVNPGASIPGEEISFLIFNADVGAADFEIAIFFSGDSYNINNWYIDDAKLFVPQEHDVATKAVLGGQYFSMGDNYEASAKIANAGLSIEAFDVVLEIFDIPTHDLLFTDTQTIDKLEPGLDTQVDFGGFTLPTENGLFEVKVFTALSGDMDPSNDTNRLYINTYTSERNLVLLEIGTGTWCVYCPGAAMGADDLIANGKNVAVMEHHSGDDYENEYSAARVSLYGIGGFPTSVFDGVISSVGGNANTSIYPTYLPLYEQRAAVNTAFNVELFGGPTGGNDYEVVAVVDKLAAAMNPNVVLHIGLTESEIPEVWFIMDHLNFVTRLMLPDAYGTPIDIINYEHVEVPGAFTLDPSWDVNHCELTYFLQDMDTKEILQGGKVMVNDLLPVSIEEDLTENGIAISNIYPNPFSNETNINFSIAEAGHVMVNIHDMTGREVAVLVNGEMASGNHQVTWEAGNISNGIYFCTISTADAKITQKVMLAK